MAEKSFFEIYEKELTKQGRKKLESGGWSEQGVLDNSEINGYWPMGILIPGWNPCEYNRGGGCVPYDDDEDVIMGKFYNHDKNDGIVLTDFGKWAPPKYVLGTAINGFSMSVWCPGPVEMVLYGMCSKCGMSITRTLTRGDDDSIEWHEQFGWGWTYFAG